MKECVAVEGLSKGWSGCDFDARSKEFCDERPLEFGLGVRLDCGFFSKKEKSMAHPTFSESYKNDVKTASRKRPMKTVSSRLRINACT